MEVPPPFNLLANKVAVLVAFIPDQLSLPSETLDLGIAH